MLPVRSVVQVAKTLNPDDEKTNSTYQDEYSNINNHGDLVQHYGNNAYLMKESNNYSHATLKPFLSPSYHNLTSQYCISNRFSDNYSNNYRSSDENPLKRPLRTAPTRTKLNHLFQYKIASIAKPDNVAVYREDYFNNRQNDHFVSRKPIKTETINLRDTIACLMELADYMRNKSYDTNSRNQFVKMANGLNQLDYCGQLFSQLIKNSENLLLAYNKLNVNANELKKIYENFQIPENLVDKNLWDRRLRPNSERHSFKETENSIKLDKEKINNSKKIAFSKLKEVHVLLNSIENYVQNNLEEIIDEAKIMLMFKLNKNDYERVYLRDSNGYIKKDAKLPIAIPDWFDLATKGLRTSVDLKKRSDDLNQLVIDLINEICQVISEQFLETHQVSSKQVENALKTQSNLIDTQYDLRKELSQLDETITDTRIKMRTCEMFDEVLLSQLSVPIAKIDPNYDENRKRQAHIANNIWSNANNLKDNLKNMLEYRKDLSDRGQRLQKNILSNHTGIIYDLKTIVGPRRHAGVMHPTANFASKSLHNFHFK